MSTTIVWWLLVAGLVGLELTTGTFYLLMIALGLAAGAVASGVGAGLVTQILLAAVVAAIGVTTLRLSGFGRTSQTAAEHDPNVNLDIGATVQVTAWNADGQARVAYRGSQWDVEWVDAKKLKHATAPVPLPEPGAYQVLAVRANRLVVG